MNQPETAIVPFHLSVRRPIYTYVVRTDLSQDDPRQPSAALANTAKLHDSGADAVNDATASGEVSIGSCLCLARLNVLDSMMIRDLWYAPHMQAQWGYSLVTGCSPAGHVSAHAERRRAGARQ